MAAAIAARHFPSGAGPHLGARRRDRFRLPCAGETAIDRPGRTGAGGRHRARRRPTAARGESALAVVCLHGRGAWPQGQPGPGRARLLPSLRLDGGVAGSGALGRAASAIGTAAGGLSGDFDPSASGHVRPPTGFDPAHVSGRLKCGHLDSVTVVAAGTCLSPPAAAPRPSPAHCPRCPRWPTSAAPRPGPWSRARPPPPAAPGRTAACARR